MSNRILLILLGGVILTSCSTRSAVEKRIEMNPQLYSKLTSEEKALIQRGEIQEGMSHEAVFLSWGRPDRVRSGSRDGTSTETWAYFGREPVSSSSFTIGTGGYGGFYSHFGVHPTWGYCHGPGWGVSNGIDFVNYVERTVEMENGRVVAWERSR